jgi:hypothetical protein
MKENLVGAGRAVIVLLAAFVVCACSREKSLTCEVDQRYEASASTPPLQVPAGLTVPDETEVLRIPQPGPGQESLQPANVGCLETPPDFFGQDGEEQ